MASHVPLSAVRQPFAVLDSPRLQHLANTKNRQNGISPKLNASGKPMAMPSLKRTSNTPTKRRLSSEHSPPTFDVFDSENIDPSAFASPTKRSKHDDGTSKPSKTTITLTTTTTPTSIFTPASTTPSSTLQPTSRLETPKRASLSKPRMSPTAPRTAPAGRSPKTKRASFLNNRRISAPFTRIDPPSFSPAASILPFSLDAALSGTLSQPTARQAEPVLQVPTTEEHMPKHWFFDIHEDTPDEEAQILMEHSALTLDISSDQEGAKSGVDRGKENTPPADYVPPTPAHASMEAPTESRAAKAQVQRRRVLKGDEMDDGERSPLSEVAAEDFYAEGLTKKSFVMVPPENQAVTELAKSSSVAKTAVLATELSTPALAKQIDEPVVKTPLPQYRAEYPEISKTPVLTGDGDTDGDVFIWEDASQLSTPIQGAPLDKAGIKRKRMCEKADAENVNPEIQPGS
ncbi:hypothetical protein LTR50_001291 [Elasticomyces elasticus]|nr:hypothetical protein LTR50_001291 [Elasticomyces elasticus]